MAICWQWFCYTWTCITILMLWIVELIYGCCRMNEHFVWSVPPPSSSCPLLSTVYLCNRCLSSRGHGGSWLGCEVLPGISAVSILELATNSRIIVNLEMSRWCHSLWISLHSLKARVWPLLW